MSKLSASWYRSVLIAAVVVALLMVPAMSWLQARELPLWLHIPLTAIVLGLLSLGAAAAGVAYLEYMERSAEKV